MLCFHIKYKHTETFCGNSASTIPNIHSQNGNIEKVPLKSSIQKLIPKVADRGIKLETAPDFKKFNKKQHNTITAIGENITQRPEQTEKKNNLSPSSVLLQFKRPSKSMD